MFSNVNPKDDRGWNPPWGRCRYSYYYYSTFHILFIIIVKNLSVLISLILIFRIFIDINIDIRMARVCTVIYIYKNTKCIKYRTHGIVTAGIFSIFYILSCLTNLIFFHALFHFFAMCAKLFVVFDPIYYWPGTMFCF